jgi:hypothetical protein
MDLFETSWTMYASVRPAYAGGDREMGFFGRLGYAQQDTLADRVVRVVLDVTDRPRPGDHWAWLDYGAHEPCHVAATEEAMTTKFRAGQDPTSPREYEQLGQGQILRLRVTVLEEVQLRSSTRSSWQISSAM